MATDARETDMESFTYQTWIKASPEEIWGFLTDPEKTGRYGYGGRTEYDLRPGGLYKVIATSEMQQLGMPEVVVDGEVLEVEEPRKLVYTWHAYFDDATAAEPANRVTVELRDVDPRMFPDGGVTTVTLTHELDGAPITAGIVSGKVADAGGGWGFILSDLKTTIESGTSLHGR